MPIAKSKVKRVSRIIPYGKSINLLSRGWDSVDADMRFITGRRRNDWPLSRRRRRQLPDHRLTWKPLWEIIQQSSRLLSAWPTTGLIQSLRVTTRYQSNSSPSKRWSASESIADGLPQLTENAATPRSASSLSAHFQTHRPLKSKLKRNCRKMQTTVRWCVPAHNLIAWTINNSRMLRVWPNSRTWLVYTR